jgi:hypothetical protein
VRKRGPCSSLLPDLLLPVAGQVGVEILSGCGEPDEEGRCTPGGWVARWRRAGSGTGRGDTGVDAGPVWLADLVRVAVALGSAGARQGVRSESRVWRGPSAVRVSRIKLFLSAKLSQCGGDGSSASR